MAAFEICWSRCWRGQGLDIENRVGKNLKDIQEESLWGNRKTVKAFS